MATTPGPAAGRVVTGAASYAHGASDVPLLGLTIGDAFLATVRRVPDVAALVSRQEGVRLSYAELATEVDRCARGLIAAGLEHGDRLGIWAPNRHEWVVLQVAAARVGVILVNINPAYRTTELGYALRQSGVRGLVLAPTLRGSDYRDMLAECDAPASLTTVVVLDDATRDGQIGWSALLAMGADVADDALADRASACHPDEPINIQYTSGTTGAPKGATLSHHNILNNGYFIGEKLHYTEADRVCIPVPFYHCFGMVIGNLACVTHGSTMVVPGEIFDPAAVLECVQEERCTSLYGVPTMFIAELDHPRFPEFDLSSLRTGVMAGSPCPVETMKRCVRDMHMTEVTICYGMTETSPVSTQSDIGDAVERRCSSVGRVHPHVEIKLVEPVSGGTVPRGQPGEVCTRGYSVMLGYWDDEVATRSAVDGARWMHTGDLGVMDGEGYVNIVGRIKDVVIRGGENVYPREVEEFLHTHPAISEAQVIGVPDPRYGEELCACIRVRAGATVTGDEVGAFCRGRIARHKVPRYIVIVDEFPMTVTGKVQKFLLRERMIRDLGLQPEPPTA